MGYTPPAANIIGEDNAYICSEYAYVCYESVGINIKYNPEGYVTPADFAKTPEINAIDFIQTDQPVMKSIAPAPALDIAN